MEIIINIPVQELNEVCAKPNTKFSTSTYFNLTNRSYVHDIFKYQKFKDDFASNIICVNNGNSIIGSFKPSYKEYLNSILLALNVKEDPTKLTEDELTEILNKKLFKLKSLPERSWLYNEFPILYRNYQKGREYIKEIEELKENPAYDDVVKIDEHYYYACGMRKSFDNYIKTQSEVYRRFIEQRLQYKEYIKNKNYNVFIRNNYDQDKLALYLTHKYLCICEKNLDDKKLLSNFYKLLEKYMNSNYYKKCEITINNNIIDSNNIKSRIENIKERIKVMTIEVPWTLIPEGRRETYVKSGLERYHKLTQEEYENLQRKGKEKEEFYSKNPPLLKVYGTTKYSGYVARIYENGNVILDREYIDNCPKTAKGNAIYHMKAIYFDMVSGLDKQKLKKHPQVGTMNHTDTWTTRAQELIDREGTPEEQEQAKQLVKRLIEENEKNM